MISCQETQRRMIEFHPGGRVMGCAAHPRNRGISTPRTGCPVCWARYLSSDGFPWAEQVWALRRAMADTYRRGFKAGRGARFECDGQGGYQ